MSTTTPITSHFSPQSHSSHQPLPPHLASLRVRDASRYCLTPGSVQLPKEAVTIMEVLVQLARDIRLCQARLDAHLFPDQIERIIQVCASAFGVSIESILGRDRSIHVAAARQVSMTLSYELLRSSVQVGRRFKRDHATVFHACRAVQSRIDTDPAFASTVESIVARLKTEIPVP